MQFTAELALLCRSLGLQLDKPNLAAKDFADRLDALAVRQQELWKDYQKVYSATNRPINLKHIAVAWDYMHQQLVETARQLRAGKLTTRPR